jgi:uncharacterized membrane protein YkvA (DUF1232 family)/uncharacterized membrane protein YgcG
MGNSPTSAKHVEIAFHYACETYGDVCEANLRVPRRIREGRTIITVHDDYSNTHVLVSTDGKTIVVSVRGTSSLEEIDTDANIAKVPYEHRLLGEQPDVLVHDGFHKAFISIRDRTIDAVQNSAGDSLLVTGHSLGGALAVLLSLEISMAPTAAGLSRSTPIECITFGAPQIGNQAFANLAKDNIPSAYRFTNTADPVPRLLSLCGFVHSHEDVNLDGFNVEGAAVEALHTLQRSKSAADGFTKLALSACKQCTADHTLLAYYTKLRKYAAKHHTAQHESSSRRRSNSSSSSSSGGGGGGGSSVSSSGGSSDGSSIEAIPFSENQIFGALKQGLEDEQNFDAAWEKVNDAGFDRMNQGPLTALWWRVVALRDFVSDNKSSWAEKGNVLTALATLAYVVSPLDLIPDYIPVVGLVDDAAVVTGCFSYLEHKLKPYVAQVERKRAQVERKRAQQMDRDDSSSPSLKRHKKSDCCDCSCAIQ